MLVAYEYQDNYLAPAQSDLFGSLYPKSRTTKTNRKKQEMAAE